MRSGQGRISYFVDKYGVFHKKSQETKSQSLAMECHKPASTWLRLIIMFWNARVLKTALRFGVAAVVMNQYDRIGFALMLLCFTV